MAYDADKVVVELIAKTDQFDQPVKQSASTFSSATKSVERDAITMTAAQFKAAGGVDGLAKSFEKVAPAAARSTAGMRQMQQATRNLGFQISDIGTQLSAGTSPFVVLAQQGPQVANALAVGQGGLARFAAFLSNPFGAAILAATSILGVLIFKHKEHAEAVDDLVEKMKKDADQSEKTRQAKEIFKGTIEGVTKALDENEDALKRLSDSELSAAQIALRQAGVQNLKLQSLRDTTQALLDQARAQLEVNNANAIGPETKGHADPRLAAANEARQRIDELQSKIGAISTQIARSQQQITDAISRYAVEVAERGPEDKIKKRYDRLIESTRQRLVSEKATTAEIVRQTQELVKQRDAELKALTAKKARASGSGYSGKQIDFAEAASIARGAGLQVNSAQRSYSDQKRLYDAWVAAGMPKDNPVAKPGSSAHEGARGRWALDIQLAPGVTAGKIKKLYADQGVDVQVFPERGHLHVSGSRSQAAAAESAAERAAQQEKAREQAFQNEKAAIEQQFLSERQQLANSAQEAADIESAANEAVRKHYEDQVKAKQADGKLTAEEASQLIDLNNERSKLIGEVIKRRLQQAQFAQEEARNQNAVTIETGLLGVQADLLQSQEQLAKSAKQRKEIEDRLIDIQFAEQRIRLQAQIAEADRLKALAQSTKNEQIIEAASKAEADAAVARAKLTNLPAEQANAHSANAQAAATPFQQFFSQIPDTADDINRAFQQIAVDGLQTFNNALANAIVNFTSLRDVGRQVLAQLATDLIKFALQQIELHTIGQLFQTTATAATTAQMAAIAAAAAPAAAMVSLATSGANSIGAQAGISSTVALATILGAPKALGGRIFGAGSDTSDNILTPSSPGEFMVKASSARSIGYGNLDFINRTGRLPDAISPSNAVAIGGRSSFSGADIQALRGLIGEAVRAGLEAMPDINLYPTVDSGEFFEKGARTNRGGRAINAHLSDNATHVKAALGKPGS